MVGFGRSHRHHFVLSPCAIKITITMVDKRDGNGGSEQFTERERWERDSARGGARGAAAAARLEEGASIADLTLKVDVQSVDVSLNEGQYASLTSWQYYLEWYKRCVRYRASGGHINCKRVDKPPVSSCRGAPRLQCS